MVSAKNNPSTAIISGPRFCARVIVASWFFKILRRISTVETEVDARQVGVQGKVGYKCAPERDSLDMHKVSIPVPCMFWSTCGLNMDAGLELPSSPYGMGFWGTACRETCHGINSIASAGMARYLKGIFHTFCNRESTSVEMTQEMMRRLGNPRPSYT
jgi:hypothetical protein